MSSPNATERHTQLESQRHLINRHPALQSASKIQECKVDFFLIRTTNLIHLCSALGVKFTFLQGATKFYLFPVVKSLSGVIQGSCISP